eukprot:TRINITY_DN13135_c0_g1_i2.p1 TRINITY_DN13135_c0_g1~~TRINITY_DN13135_c0_g1_i2.p1  ORF type:complete len:674 (+),score=98.10 TRINITY_DN13135_c0_g1_i2:59-2080(+)
MRHALVACARPRVCQSRRFSTINPSTFEVRNASCLVLAPWASSSTTSAWKPHPAWDVRENKLAKRACSAAKLGIRDPFLWQVIRLRSCALVNRLRIREIAVLLGSSVRVGLVDRAFLIAMGSRVETLVRWSRGPPSQATDLIVCCNAFLRAGLDVHATLFQDILRVIARSFSKPSPFDAALLSSCLARLRQTDHTLLRGSEAVVLQSTKEDGNCLSALVQQSSMLFCAMSLLLPQRRPEELATLLLKQLRSLALSSRDTSLGLRSTAEEQEACRRSLLAVIQAEVAWAGTEVPGHKPSELLRHAAKELAGLPHGGSSLLSLSQCRSVAEACRCWGHETQEISALAPWLIHELRRLLPTALASRRDATLHSSNLKSGMLLRCLSSTLPLSVEMSALRSERVAETLLEHLTARVKELNPGQLVVLTELCGLTGGFNSTTSTDSGAADGSSQRAQVLRSELYRRARDLPLSALPRALAAVLQILPAGPESDFLPVLRRCTGRLAFELSEQLRAGTTANDRIRLFDGDAVGEVMYVCASCNYRDDTFLEASESWILAQSSAVISAVRRDVSLVHLLHSFAVLKVLGVLDATALLQAEADKPPSASALDFGNGPSAPPPSGIGEQALTACIARLVVLLPTLDIEDLRACAILLRSMRVPNGSSAPEVFAKASEQGIQC